jgi:hypothetical protein
MGKLLLLIVAGLAVAFSIEGSRMALLERMGPLANPGYRWITNQELGQIVDDLELHQRSRGEIPIGRRGEFDAWMNSRYPQPRSRQDPWGTRYRAELHGTDGFRVISAGPDGEFGTPDDLWKEGVRTTTGPRPR